jgi:NAD(P)-dependent dehydrogenase (short-subunit alcohol dehydrogenase family)
MKLQKQVAIITGAGRGIGKVIALAYAHEGADMVLVSRTLSEVEETATQIRAMGRHALALKVDVSNKDAVEKMVRLALQEFGRIDILVNNAGILGPVGPLIENDSDEWIETVKVNLLGVFLCCKAVAPLMIKQGKGKIINLSGGGAASSRPFFSAYAASKTAIVRLTEILAAELKEFNVQVNAIAPGAVNTSIHNQVLSAGERLGESVLAEARKVKKTGGTPPDVPAALAVFLASDESGGLTGKLISAVWDNWKELGKQADRVNSSDLYTLRRIVPTN